MSISDLLKSLYDNLVLAVTTCNEFTSALPDCYDAVDAKGGTLPSEQTADNLASAIATIPGGEDFGDLSWWTPALYSKVYSGVNSYSPNDNAIASPFLTKASSDVIKATYAFSFRGQYCYNSLTPSFNEGAAKSEMIINTYNSSYAKINWWNWGAHLSGGSALGSATIFRIFTTKHYARYMKIENITQGTIIWQGDRYNGYQSVVDNDISKENLIAAINAELSPQSIYYLSATKYAELSVDADVIAALTNNPNVTLASA